MKKERKVSFSICILLVLISISTFMIGKKDVRAVTYVDLNGKYHAAMGLQTCTKAWLIRYAYFDKEANAYYGTEKAGTLIAEDPSAKGKEYAGNFTDVEITGNGTYTVSLEGADFGGETDLSQLHVATDIPLNDQIKFTDVSFSVNGKTVTSFDEGYMEDEEPYLGGGMDLLLINGWREPLVKKLEEKGLKKKGSGYSLIKGTGNESISITFTISGFNYKEGETAPEGNAYVLPKVPKKGQTTTIAGLVYQVTKSDKSSGTVTIVKQKKKKTTVKIPKTITWNSYSFKVTSIGSSVFKRNIKLKKVIIENNIKIIGKKAFYGCKNLKVVKIPASVRKIGSRAFQRCSKNLTIVCKKGSYAWKFAKQNQLKYKIK